MNLFVSILDGVMLFIVLIGCWFHLNSHSDWHAPWCQKLGFIITGVAALVGIVVLFVPGLNRPWVPLLLHVGMFFIVLAIYRGDFRAVMAWARTCISERRKKPQRIDHTERRGAYGNHN